MHSRDVIKALKKSGWYEVNQVGSHLQFKPNENGESDGTTSESGHTDRDPQEHRETGRDQA
jgi:predicted RNA binding protein YcfA (HicA-like mRNA interferase family)